MSFSNLKAKFSSKTSKSHQGSSTPNSNRSSGSSFTYAQDEPKSCKPKRSPTLAAPEYGMVCVLSFVEDELSATNSTIQTFSFPPSRL